MKLRLNFDFFFKLPLHPFLFAAFPFIFLAAHNIYQIQLEELWQPLLILQGILLFLFGIGVFFGGFQRNKERVALLLSGILFFFFSYGHWVRAIPYLKEAESFFLPFWGMLFLGSVVSVCRLSPKTLEKLTKPLNAMALFLVLWNLGQIGLYFWRFQQVQEKKNATVLQAEKKEQNSPDIYYLIFDRYAGLSTLRRVYHFDNRPFLRALQERGFYVAYRSQANYLKTGHSLASSLNLNYLDELPDQGPDWKPIYQKLQKHKVGQFLKKQGYQWIHCGSWWGPTRKNAYADFNINKISFSEFLGVLYETTVLHPIATQWKLGISFLPDLRKEHWHRIRYKFDQLEKIATWASPKFVFAHMITPHVPYIFEEDGRYVSSEENRYKTREKNYVQQLKYINKRILQCIDEIQKKSKTPPIIILQSDEGPLPLRYERNEKQFQWKEASPLELQEKFGILNAYAFPQLKNPALYPEISPVNSFRFLFNHYFQAQYPLLEDECVAFENERSLYSFFKVTDKVKQK